MLGVLLLCLSSHDAAAAGQPGGRWVAEGNQIRAHFGISVATAGDVNGDGFSDAIVGAETYRNGEIGEGRAFVYHGSATGLILPASWTAESNDINGYFGRSVGPAGDVNGDGFDDVIVGAPGAEDDFSDEGWAFVYHGSPAGLEVDPPWTAQGNQHLANFGSSVGAAGDVNGDGFDDVIVGTYLYDGDEADEGRASVYLGSPAGLSEMPGWTAEGEQEGAWFGHSVGTAGDVNGDGFDDVIVGANHYDDGEGDEGQAFVFLGSSSGPSATASWTAASNHATANFGHSVGAAGDVNGDGFDDVIVGAPFFDGPGRDAGRAFVFHGSASGLSNTPRWRAGSDQRNSDFGDSVGTAGDANGDGYDDVIVGASDYADGSGRGRAFVYVGSRQGLSTSPLWATGVSQPGAYFGRSVGTARDIDADGYDEVIVGAFLFEHGESGEGAAFVYPGRA